jgi:glycosyltransferase involved in cell wall biosynthesis
MRVLQIVHGSEAGGVKTLSEIIQDGLGSRGVTIETAVMFPPPDPGLFAKFGGARRVVRRILSGRYDAVVAYQSTASILTGLVGWFARCPHRFVHQTALPSEVKAPLRWLDRVLGTLGFYTANIANSRATVAAFAHYPARYRRSMTLIEHGVPAPRTKHARSETLRRFGIPDDRRILLNSGRLTDQKNQAVLIRALAQVPSIRLVIAGEGPLRGNYTALAQQLGVSDRLHLLGDVTRDDIADLLAACDLFVFPSTWETFGLAAVEAAISGIAIVASDLPVLREVLSADGAAAAVFAAPFDTAAWVRAIASSMHTDPQARRAIARRYSVARMIEAYAALLGAAARVDGAPWHGGCVTEIDSGARCQPVLIQDRLSQRAAQ